MVIEVGTRNTLLLNGLFRGPRTYGSIDDVDVQSLARTPKKEPESLRAFA